ncbi:uncharacterized protein EAF01_000842 [Botrytis porri]|uniref:Uncharacterized protein n=1 Tax=Botrytis porri TaxID=87229 RepID=A0A4Z1KU04_9HELO|nr:uncharacterized protein EAF01_000842 [Botrytis porri]KAF7914436.1 hypothetical protein EAF01_000842 [Botrytis porri]TGO87987.1 hypothetical protein BPOR_0191g00060 [Botrytis porri]
MSRTNLTMHPSRMLQLCGVSLGVRIALSKSGKTFKPELKAYRAIADDSTIFRLCRGGRTDAIRYLFDEGLASPRDTDSYGRTPLMFAASTGQLSTCKFLVNEGADVELRDIQNDDLGSYACGTWTYGYGKGRVPFGFSHSENRVQVPCDIRIEVLRMFLERYGRELSWGILLDKLQLKSDLSSGLEDILREREEDLIRFQSIEGRTCSCYGELGMSYATENERIIARCDLYYDPLRRAATEREAEVEDSIFLLSI